MQKSLMPKGVDHNGLAEVGAVKEARAKIFDAERR